MAKKNIIVAIPKQVIESKIHEIRGKKVMLSNDLAELYQVEARVLNQQVKRNLGRFPERYMFQLTIEEYKALRSQNVTLERGQYSKYPPYAFTEHGVLMLSSVLRSERAEKVNLLIIDTFVELNEMLASHKQVLLQLEELKDGLAGHDKQIALILKYIKQLEQSDQGLNQKERKKIGYEVKVK